MTNNVPESLKDYDYAEYNYLVNLPTGKYYTKEEAKDYTKSYYKKKLYRGLIPITEIEWFTSSRKGLSEITITNGIETFIVPENCSYAEFDYSKEKYTGKFFTKDQYEEYEETDSVGLETVESMLYLDKFKEVIE